MRFYLSAVEKTVYRKAIEADSADEAVAKFKEMIDQSIIEDEGTYLDEVMCRTEGQGFPEIYDGAEDEEEDDNDEDEDGEEEDDEGEDEADLEQTPSSEVSQPSEPSQPSSFNQNQY